MPDTVPAARSAAPALPLIALPAAGCLSVLLGAFLTGRAAAVVALVGFLAWCLGLILLRRRLESAADLPDERLDEREVAARDRSYLGAYQVLGGTLALVLFVAVLHESSLGDGAVVQSWTYLLFAVLLLAVALPSMVLAARRTADA